MTVRQRKCNMVGQRMWTYYVSSRTDCCDDTLIKEDHSADAHEVAARAGPRTSRKQWRRGLVRVDRRDTECLSCGQFRGER